MTAFGNKLATAGIASSVLVRSGSRQRFRPRRGQRSQRFVSRRRLLRQWCNRWHSNPTSSGRCSGPGSRRSPIAAIALSIAELRAIATENCAPCRMHVPTTAREPKAESPRTRIVVSALMARAVLIALRDHACGTLGRVGPPGAQPRPGDHRRRTCVTGGMTPTTNWRPA